MIKYAKEVTLSTVIDEFKVKVMQIYGETRPFSMVLADEDMDSLAELIYTEDLLNEFTNGLLWAYSCHDIPRLRQAWINALKEGRMDERLALRIL